LDIGELQLRNDLLLLVYGSQLERCDERTDSRLEATSSVRTLRVSTSSSQDF
jgi:hypothetical protein